LGDFDLNIIKGSISVLFTSQADIEVEIKAFYLDFYFNENKVGYLEEASAFIIPAKGNSTIDLEFTLNPQLVIGNAVDIIDYTLNSKDANIYISGFARLKSGFINVTLPIEYNTTLRELLK
jgi:LEA14-like dessication related protein